MPPTAPGDRLFEADTDDFDGVILLVGERDNDAPELGEFDGEIDCEATGDADRLLDATGVRDGDGDTLGLRVTV